MNDTSLPSDPPKPAVLVVDDDPLIRASLRAELAPEYDVTLAENFEKALKMAQSQDVAASLLDISLSGKNGLDLIPYLRGDRNRPVLMLTGHHPTDSMDRAFRMGAIDYIPKPFHGDDVRSALRRSLRPHPEGLEREFLGRSSAIVQLRKNAKKVARSGLNILITGESGTGKEILARSIHRSRDQSRPFIAINCAAIPKELIESTLFGHERGAFTGASETRIGKFELAHGGDIFLDEIGSLDLSLQAKLLRVLQEKEFERVGGNRVIRSDFRVLSATNENLTERCKAGQFREDLVYRLSAVELTIPPLRERPEDIALFINEYLHRLDRNPHRKTLSPQARADLSSLSWPGNVRQLYHALDQMLALSETAILQASEIPAHLRTVERAEEPKALRRPLEEFQRAMDDYERTWILRALEDHRGHHIRAAQALGISRSSLYGRMKRLKIPCRSAT